MKKFIKLTSVFLVLVLLIELLPMSVFSAEPLVDEVTETISSDGSPETLAPAEILSEDVSKREQNVKHFLMSDGSYRATQYDIPVHFLQNGEWVDYDNTLSEVAAAEEESATSNKDLKNTFADYSVRLSKKTNGHKFVRVEKDGYKLSWYYLNANKVTAQIAEISDDNDATTLEKVVSRVVYSDVYENIDFEYIISSVGVKENILIKAAGTQNVFTAEYKANGLTPVLIDATTIHLVDSNNAVAYIISAPYMTDANGEISTDITLAVSSVQNNTFTVTTTVNKDWLLDENRAFPVTVDPVLSTTQEYGETESAFVATADTDKCYSAQSGGADSGSLYVGNISGYGTTESYLKVNALPTLSVADTVVNAQIGLALKDCDLGLRMDIHRVIEPWQYNSVTWDTKPEYNTMILDYKMLEDGDYGAIFFEITDTVRGWYSGEYANYGIALTTKKTSASKAWMYSSRISQTEHPGCRPVLFVDYRNMSGYEDYWSYTGIEAGRGGAASVNNYNGNFVFSQPVTLDNGGNLMPVSLSVVYNANGESAEYTYMARNIQTNFHLFVKYYEPTAGQGYKYYFNDADGTKHYFKFEINSTTDGKDEDGLGYTLDVIEVGSDSLCTNARFRITDKNKTKMFFDYWGKVIQITNQNGVSATVQYEAVSGETRIKSVKDGAGRTYSFKYNPYYPNLCTSIVDPKGRETFFNYAGGSLNSIVFPDSETVSLEYTDYMLSGITAIDGTRTSVEYDTSTQRRVKSVSWGIPNTSPLQKYTFTYKQNETVVSDKHGRKYTYQFNNYAQTTGIVSNEDGRAQYFEYTPGGGNSPTANKLLSESKVINTVTNHVVNPGFTRDLSNGYTTHISTDAESAYVRYHNDGNFTQKSLEIYKPVTETGYALVRQDIENLSAGTYTFSGYVFSYNQPETSDGIYFGITIYNSNDEYLRYYAAEGIYKTNGWERKELTFEVNEGECAQIVLGFMDSAAGGTVWFDDLQVESGTSANNCNLIENNNYENGKTAWENGTISLYANLGSFSRSLWIEGRTDPENKWNNVRQYVLIDEGKKGDVFSFGAWVKADSAPLDNGTKTGDSCIPEFYVGLHFYNSSDQWVQSEYINVNEDINTWQFLASEAVAKQDYKKIRIDLAYDNNVNYAYITGAFCYREQFGQTYTYDNDGNVVSSVDLTTAASSFAHQDNKLATMLNPSGSEYIYSYNKTTGNLSFATSTDGVQYSFTYDNKGNPTSAKMKSKKLITAVTGNTVCIIQNKYSGNVIDAYGEGDTTIVNFSDYGNTAYQKWELQPVPDEAGAYYLYNSQVDAWLVVKGTSNTNNAKFAYETSGDGNRFRFKLEKNTDGTFTILTKSSGYTKCIDGMPGDTTDCSNDTPIRQYEVTADDAGQRWYLFSPPSDSDYIEASATYTANGNFISSETDQRGKQTTYNYDQTTGTLISVQSPNGTTTNYTYVANSNQLASVSAGGMTNSYTYGDDRLEEINVNGGTYYAFTYDDYGRTSGIRVGDGHVYSLLSSNAYNDKGLISNQYYGNGDYIYYTYDNLDRLTEKGYNNGVNKKITYSYTSNGSVSQTIDYFSNRRTKYIYDLSGRLVGTREYNGTALRGTPLLSSVDYTYADKTNYLTDVKFRSPLGTQTLSYCYGDINLGQMPDAVYGVKFNGGDDKVTYTYDSLGRLSVKSVNGMGNTYTYLDGQGNKTTTLLSSLATANGTYIYTYDDVGNIISISLGEDENVIKSYEYDSLGQLVRENDAEANTTYVYAYSNGNIVSKTSYAYTTDSLGQALNTTYWSYNNEWRDLLTYWNGKSISYDEIGNPLNIGSTSLSWLGRQLMTVTDGSKSTAYAYNADGQRISKTVTDSSLGSASTTEYYYIGSMLAGEKRGGNTLVYMNDAGGDIYGFVYNGTEYYYVKNAQNDVVAIADASKSIKVRYYYDAWGNLIDMTDTSANNIGTINPIRYRSYYYDSETGWYYLNSRYYNPQMCRFLNADGYVSTGQGVLGNNMFAYCGNNPVNRFDPTGLFWREIGQWFSDVWSGVQREFKKTVDFVNETTYSIYYSLTSFHFEDRIAKNGTHPSYEEVKENKDWRLLPPEESKFHDDGVGANELKFIHLDGREAVFDGDTLEPETDARYMATYNYYVLYELPQSGATLDDYVKYGWSYVMHGVADVLPYWLTGNSNTREQFEEKVVSIFG